MVKRAWRAWQICSMVDQLFIKSVKITFLSKIFYIKNLGKSDNFKIKKEKKSVGYRTWNEPKKSSENIFISEIFLHLLMGEGIQMVVSRNLLILFATIWE